MIIQMIALCVLGVLLFVSLFVFSKDKLTEWKEEGISHEDFMNIPTHQQVEKPTLPNPSLADLNIGEGSKLSIVFDMLIKGDIITDEILMRKIGSKRCGIFIFRLREKGMIIDTLIMPNGKTGYIFRNFKL